jgi:LysM repeat protein
MTLRSVLKCLLMLAPLALFVSGCFPMASEVGDEQKDPFYLRGKSRYSAMDYDGAFAAFERALISNPKSAAAHLELGFLCEEKRQNYAAAIYHFQKHLELRPESNMAETVKLHIFACTLELAKKAPFALVSRQVQDEMRRLNATNLFLLEQNSQLKMQMQEQAVAFSNRIASVMQAAAARSSAPTPSEPERRPSGPERSSPAVSYTPSRSTAPALSSTPRTHLVRPGDTFASIAKRYNIRLTSLQAANPTVEPRRLKAGQILNLPAPRN